MPSALVCSAPSVMLRKLFERGPGPGVLSGFVLIPSWTGWAIGRDTSRVPLRRNVAAKLGLRSPVEPSSRALQHVEPRRAGRPAQPCAALQRGPCARHWCRRPVEPQLAAPLGGRSTYTHVTQEGLRVSIGETTQMFFPCCASLSFTRPGKRPGPPRLTTLAPRTSRIVQLLLTENSRDRSQPRPVTFAIRILRRGVEPLPTSSTPDSPAASVPVTSPERLN